MILTMQAVIWEDENVCWEQASLEFDDLRINALYIALYFHNHTQDGKHPPENSGYDGIVGRNAGFGQTDLNVFDSFVSRA